MALINVSSPSAAFSEYVLTGLEAILVDNGKLVVVDRANLDKIRAEQGFQMSGEVSDESAKSIGQMLGAGAIVTGSLTNIGASYRLTLKAINVERATVAVSYPVDISADERVRALLSGGGAPAAAPNGGAGGGQVPAGATTPATATAAQPAPASPAPAPTAPPPQTQLFAGETLQGEMDLLDALDWITMNAKSGGKYTIALGRDYAITPTDLDYGGKTVTLTLKSAGGQRAISFEGANPSYSLFIVKSGVTLTLENGITLRGTQNAANKSLVEVAGGRFIMNGGVITGNKKSGQGGGVNVTSGGFTMNGGSINGNTTDSGDGGGVYVGGTFTMNGGVISGNTAAGSGVWGGWSSGGGVYIKGTFIMKSGDIIGNSASKAGGGVYADTFTMSGGTISGNTAADGGGGGVFAGTFTMNDGTISRNISNGNATLGNDSRGGRGGGVFTSEFTMNGGILSGNTANTSGGGVYASRTFTKSGGVIYGSNGDEANSAKSDNDGHAVYANGKKRNTTARATTAMDSGKDGPAGGWE
jgi:hypothetical protein